MGVLSLETSPTTSLVFTVYENNNVRRNTLCIIYYLHESQIKLVIGLHLLNQRLQRMTSTS